MAAFDIKNYFNVTLPPLLANAKPRRPGRKYRLNIVGPAGGVWFLDDTGPSIALGVTPLDSVDCDMSISDADFMNVMTQPPSPSRQFVLAYMAGKLTSTGVQKFSAARFGFLLRLK